MIWWVSLALAADPVPVTTGLGDDVFIDWTRGVLQASASARQQGVDASRKAAEQRARQEVGPRVLQGVREVPVTTGLGFDVLQQDEDLGPSLRSRVAEWVVSETRYFTSGQVGLTGELSLQALLKPWVWSRARAVEGELEEAAFTGLLVDARGLEVEPAYAPRLLDADGAVLWDGVLLADVALDVAPTVWVTDPADAAVARVGEAPLWLFPASASGSSLTLTPELSASLRAAQQGTRLGASGDVVVVVDP